MQRENQAILPAPYVLMAILFLSLAVLMALATALTSWRLIPWLPGLRWLRIHVITLGALTQVIFGVLPGLIALHADQPRPSLRWDIWLALNTGLLILFIGIPLVHAVLIITGGILVFIAASLLLVQLWGLRQGQARLMRHVARPFYLAGLGYLLLGIIVGTGLWFGWGAALRIATPIEVHIHANNWGFLSLVFAGLLIDYYPRFTNHALAWPRSIKPIFWMLTLGAGGLVLGPWLGSNWFAVPGLILHLSATIWLLLNVALPLRGDRSTWTVGIWHLLSAYVWILAPVLIAPLIIFGVPGFPGAGIEQNAPQALTYGWVLQFGYAMLPYLFRRAFLPHVPATLGGHWFSLITVHAGGIALWASIFLTPYYVLLHGVAYALWMLSALPIVIEIWRIIAPARQFEPDDRQQNLNQSFRADSLPPGS
jgi:hypothetical protein